MCNGVRRDPWGERRYLPAVRGQERSGSGEPSSFGDLLIERLAHPYAQLELVAPRLLAGPLARFALLM